MNISLNSISEAPVSLIDNDSFNSACFAVAKRQLGYVGQGDFVQIDKQAIVRMDNSDVLYIGSNNYNLVRNSDIVLGLDELAGAGYKPVKVRSIHGKQFYFELGYQPPEGDNLTINGLPCVVRIRVQNSYDGTKSFGLSYGIYILKCMNGMVVPLADSNINFNFKHTSFVPKDVADFIVQTTILAKPYLISRVGDIKFDDHSCEPKLNAIAKIFPKSTKQGVVHEAVKTLIARTNYELEQDPSANENFALFMAATQIATYPDKYNLSPSYVEPLEAAIAELFTN